MIIFLFLIKTICCDPLIWTVLLRINKNYPYHKYTLLFRALHLTCKPWISRLSSFLQPFLIYIWKGVIYSTWVLLHQNFNPLYTVCVCVPILQRSPSGSAVRNHCCTHLALCQSVTFIAFWQYLKYYFKS